MPRRPASVRSTTRRRLRLPEVLRHPRPGAERREEHRRSRAARRRGTRCRRCCATRRRAGRRRRDPTRGSRSRACGSRGPQLAQERVVAAEAPFPVQAQQGAELPVDGGPHEPRRPAEDAVAAELLRARPVGLEQVLDAAGAALERREQPGERLRVDHTCVQVPSQEPPWSKDPSQARTPGRPRVRVRGLQHECGCGAVAASSRRSRRPAPGRGCCRRARRRNASVAARAPAARGAGARRRPRRRARGSRSGCGRGTRCMFGDCDDVPVPAAPAVREAPRQHELEVAGLARREVWTMPSDPVRSAAARRASAPR